MSDFSRLELELRVSVLSVLVTKLAKSLSLYAAHLENCGMPCDCGLSSEVENLLAQARRAELRIHE